MHIDKQAKIAKTVLIAGDPKRTKWAAEKLLTNPILVSDVRAASVYTGTYKGHEVSFATSGMGQPSIAIYATELFVDHDVQKIVRVGTTGTYKDDIDIGTVVEAYKVVSQNSIFEPNKNGWQAIEPKFTLGIGRPVLSHCSDLFYNDNELGRNDLDVVDMESYALLYLGNKFNRHAHVILTVSDNLNDSSKIMTALQREQATLEMYQMVLNKLFE
ncbi:purine-nucleoside phosphorylase [Mesoplasma syrphidae]|uniref:Uridine phosphorylase n=1 Tax=Mesoplasma syrphidae TaxID=225999 RepID=A0A2K9C2Z9_9MOLU|nr:purine-nucleoside phosphorylase [Mesoplasma syrphidae]AUF83849.1 purine-nucleoside phosphorylase [Mesoplasma syrphidae]